MKVKKYLSSVVVLVFIFLFFSSFFRPYQIDIWEDLEVFHQAIALTFHPAEDGDFKPVRTDSKELVDAAKRLSETKLPAYFEKKENTALKEEVLKSIKTLLEQSSELHNLAKTEKTTNEVLLVALKELHSTYHQIEELDSKARKN